jgi:hypothetical protein
MSPLETERSFLASHREQLLAQYGDKFLVICGEQVTAAFDTIEQALEGAATRHGLQNVLIRRASEAQIEFSAPALALGILSADTPPAVRG